MILGLLDLLEISIMKQFFRILKGTCGVILCVVTTVQGQTLEERIRAIETNVQRLQKEMEQLKSKVESLPSQRSGTQGVSGPESVQSLAGEGLNLSSLKVGETLGENLVIQEDENENKYVSCSKGGGVVGKLEFPSLRLSNTSEVTVSANFQSSSWSIIITSTGSSIRVASLLGAFIEFGDERGKKNFQTLNIGWRQQNAVNDIKVSINNNTASFYLNDGMIATHTLSKPGTEYNNLIINGIQNTDRLFRVNWKNL
jgi:hypothetical protein